MYRLIKTDRAPSLRGEWESEIWQRAEAGTVAHFLPRSSDHHPHVQFKLLYDDRWIYGIFRVEDRFVRSVITEYNGSVCGDSCVEFFVKPKPGQGYFNFEINCGGCLLLSYIEDPTITPKGFARWTPVSAEEGRQVKIFHSMPAVVDPELPGPVTWINEFHIPLSLLEKYVGPLDALEGQEWQANLYKCGDKTSHPHWGTWAPIQGASFHQPQYFAPLCFDGVMA